jgi:hypothetical protein
MTQAATRHVRLSDGQLADASELDAMMPAVDAFLQELLERTLGTFETAADAATVPGATDKGSATVTTFGFFGASMRVYRVDATHIKLKPGMGLQFDDSADDGWPVRVMRLDAAAVEVTDGIALTSLPTAGNYKRALVLTCARTVTTNATAQVMDSSGNVASATVPGRTFPEIGAPAGVVTNIVVQYGASAGSAGAAARPAGLAGYVALAELLLDETGLANDANPDGVTPGITDLRPRIRPSKAAGAYDSRRATCSMDEATAARNARRMGAKRVGVEEVDGWVQIATGGAAVVTLDTSRDWRDAMVRVEHCALAGVDNLPGGTSDSAYTRNTNNNGSAVENTGAVSAIGVACFYSELGSADGSSGPTSGVCSTAADDASTSLIFFADSTTGALKCRGVAGGTLRELYFVAQLRGPLGKAPATGVES